MKMKAKMFAVAVALAVVAVCFFIAPNVSEDVDAANEVASIGNDKYTTLQGAIDGAKLGDTIIVLTDVILNDGLEVNSTVEIILDLNGHTISYDSSENTGNATITNRGNLTIIDGSLSKVGKITYDSSAPDTNFGYATNTITNYSALTIKNGVIENTCDKGCSIAIDNNSTNADATLIVDGGHIISDYRTIRQFANSSTYGNSVTINGGIVESTSNRVIWVQLPGGDAAVTQKATLTVNDGTLTTKGLSAISVGSSGSSFGDVEVKITGGILNGEVTLNNSENPNIMSPDFAKVTVSGGTFTTNSYGGSGIKNKADLTVPTGKILVSGGTFEVMPDKSYFADDISFVTDSDGKIVVGYEITVSTEDSYKGIVTGSGIYAPGTEVAITATPSSGYIFSYWVVDGNIIYSNEYKFNATKSCNCIAVFEIDESYLEVIIPSTNQSDGIDQNTTFILASCVLIFAILGFAFMIRKL